MRQREHLGTPRRGVAVHRGWALQGYLHGVTRPYRDGGPGRSGSHLGAPFPGPRSPPAQGCAAELQDRGSRVSF